MNNIVELRQYMNVLNPVQSSKKTIEETILNSTDEELRNFVLHSSDEILEDIIDRIDESENLVEKGGAFDKLISAMGGRKAKGRVKLKALYRKILGDWKEYAASVGIDDAFAKTQNVQADEMIKFLRSQYNIESDIEKELLRTLPKNTKDPEPGDKFIHQGNEYEWLGNQWALNADGKQKTGVIKNQDGRKLFHSKNKSILDPKDFLNKAAKGIIKAEFHSDTKDSPQADPEQAQAQAQDQSQADPEQVQAQGQTDPEQEEPVIDQPAPESSPSVSDNDMIKVLSAMKVDMRVLKKLKLQAKKPPAGNLHKVIEKNQDILSKIGYAYLYLT